LIAFEPDVISPVCLAWDADGRMFVVEMTDYPLGPTGGRVRMLEDRDGNGRYESVTVFADKLPFPTSVLPWRGGVLVAAAPDIWFLKDNDGDGQADERHVLFHRLRPGQSAIARERLTWASTTGFYGANGRSDGEVRAVELPSGSDWAMAGRRWPARTVFAAAIFDSGRPRASSKRSRAAASSARRSMTEAIASSPGTLCHSGMW
jgi:putative membrane-bound dehydrogenase-like protein